MTELEFERSLRHILIDAIKADEACVIGEAVPFNPSLQYQKRMHHMAKNPLKWLRNQGTPLWKKVAKQIAVIVLAVSVGFGGLMAVSPSVRAAVIRWVVEWYETHIVYQYSGDDPSSELGEYAITALPEGFSEIDRIEVPNTVAVTYTDLGGNIIGFDYIYMHQGVTTNIVIENSTVIDVTVDGMTGQFFETTVPGEFNTIIWIDEQNNTQFSISGSFSKEKLLDMALSVRG